MIEKLTICAAALSFSDAGGDGYGRPPHLRREAEALATGIAADSR